MAQEHNKDGSAMPSRGQCTHGDKYGCFGALNGCVACELEETTRRVNELESIIMEWCKNAFFGGHRSCCCKLCEQLMEEGQRIHEHRARGDIEETRLRVGNATVPSGYCKISVLDADGKECFMVVDTSNPNTELNDQVRLYSSGKLVAVFEIVNIENEG